MGSPPTWYCLFGSPNVPGQRLLGSCAAPSGSITENITYMSGYTQGTCADRHSAISSLSICLGDGVAQQLWKLQTHNHPACLNTTLLNPLCSCVLVATEVHPAT